jgi:hypothetical protein
LLLALAVGAIFWMFVAAVQHDPTPTPKNRTTPTVSNQAQGLLILCGPPSLDISSQYDVPRPLIVTRAIEYKKYNLRFIFLPGDNKPADAPPPYKWQLMGATDMAENEVVNPSEIHSRMPCFPRELLTVKRV